ncbi:unnamed protein product [Rangifer tarandus platyrhynchus]|uniref:Uncharacterized protein n=2 Tax=Rangifer tarandus platyrhynchus TaxID=3082113 RepID=A0ABN8ZVH5_RANTA|nr:unnamed protein product [Rangifer tarandus platyrhynchus]
MPGPRSSTLLLTVTPVLYNGVTPITRALNNALGKGFIPLVTTAIGKYFPITQLLGTYATLCATETGRQQGARLMSSTLQLQTSQCHLGPAGAPAFLVPEQSPGHM